MEHGLILLIQAILAIDRNLQKPIRAVVPDLSRLRTDPQATLAEQEIIFGPRKAYAASLVVGSVVAALVLLIFGLSALDRPANQKVEPWYFVVVAVCVFLTGAAATALMVRWLRGGSAILREEGVAFVHRGRTVFCPWELFQSAGSPYHPDHDRVIVPANDSTPVAVSDILGNVVAKPAEEVKSKPLTGVADGQVALTNLYEVRLGELAELLLFLGRQLGNGTVDDGENVAPSLGRGPLATAEPKGWIRIRLTRLPFPPVCVGCGLHTRDSFPVAIGTESKVQIAVPSCTACQRERRRSHRRAGWIGLGLGVAPVVLACAIGAAFADAETLLVMVFLSLPIGIVVGVIGGLIVRANSAPVRFSDYSQEAGTIALRLRPSPGASAFRRSLGLADETVVRDSQ